MPHSGRGVARWHAILRVAARGGPGTGHRRAGETMAGSGQRDGRGQALSVMVLVVTTALLLMAGLVVDGGRQVAAERRATRTAEQAARAATDAAAASVLEGRPDARLAAASARDVLAADPGVEGTVSIRPGLQVHVETRAQAPTTFLSLLGIRTVRGSAAATADLVRVP